MPILATETACATSGREGKVTSPAGKIDLGLAPASARGPGTIPKQLFAAGWSESFGSAIAAAASQAKIPLRLTAGEWKPTSTFVVLRGRNRIRRPSNDRS